MSVIAKGLVVIEVQAFFADNASLDYTRAGKSCSGKHFAKRLES
jgi:hypothetical protein